MTQPIIARYFGLPVSLALAAFSSSVAAPPPLSAYLKPGFPTYALFTAGTYTGGPSICVVVADVNATPGLEIFGTSLSNGPLYGWTAAGVPLPGWPVTYGPTCYPAAGNLDGDPFAEIIALYRTSSSQNLFAFDASGTPLPGWSQWVGNYFSIVPVVADLDDDGSMEVVFNAEDTRIHVFNANGVERAGWPQFVEVGSQRTFIPVVADLDGDGQREVLAGGGYSSAGKSINAWHKNGTPVAGFPIITKDAYGYGPGLVVGDVGAASGFEQSIVVGNFTQNTITVFRPNGTIAPGWPVTVGYGAYFNQPVLADLDGDGKAEIIEITDSPLKINVLRGDGTVFPGWPVLPAASSSDWRGDCLPVVGDFDCDGAPEIVFITQIAGSGTQSRLHVMKANGAYMAGFPASVELGSGSTPAIADIDRDGKVDVVAMSSAWNGTSGTFPHIYAWSFCFGSNTSAHTLWGQLGGNASHTGWYPNAGGAKTGDITGNGLVNINDLVAVITHWGSCPPGTIPGESCLADVNRNGVVDIDDLVAVITHWT